MLLEGVGAPSGQHPDHLASTFVPVQSSHTSGAAVGFAPNEPLIVKLAPWTSEPLDGGGGTTTVPSSLETRASKLASWALMVEGSNGGVGSGFEAASASAASRSEPMVI